ncbi:MAG: alpha/beta fold hydrolase [Armatimonadetes bacterium]|nr:alpha/beta fold hydrolase [Armatimonadota bacterium]
MRRFERRKIPLDTAPGHWLYVLEGGRPGRPAILFIHGAAGCSGNWIYQLRALADHFHVFAPDMRGHGRSPWPGPSHLEDFYADLRALVDRLPLSDRFALVCHSFGAAVACRLACELRPRVAGLGLFNTAGHLPLGLFYRLMLLGSGFADQFRRHYPWMVSTNSQVSRWVLRFPVREWDCWRLFPELDMPSLVVLGGLDLLIPARLGKKMAEILPNSELRLVPSGGHVLMVEQPFESTRWLLGLLKKAFRA